jgi:phosphoglycolate phosphatase
MQESIKPTVVFDLDGTLVDTVPDIAAALDTALACFGSSPTSPNDAAAMMGDGLSAFFWRAIVAKRLNLTAKQADEAQKHFISAYKESPAQLSKIYPGIRKLLDELRSSGVNLAVCTNKYEPIALTILESLDLRDYFGAVVGFRDDRPKKPDPGPLLEAIAGAGGNRARAIMIGDSGADSGAAIAACIPAILVSYGYSPVPVKTLSGNVYVDSAFELHDEIMNFILVGAVRTPNSRSS